MKRSTYLHVILTTIAVLLAAHLWVSVSERPLFSQNASAVSAPPASGIPDAATQRREIVDAINDLRQDVQKTNKLIETAKFKVEVSNLAELKGDS